MLGAHGFALTASYHPSLGNDTKYDCGLKKFTLSKKLGETILRKKYASTFKEPRGSPTSNGGTPRRSRCEIHTRVSPTGNLRKRNNDATIGRERTNTKNENGVSAWSRRNSNDDISTNFRPISMLQKSTQSSWNCEQCETVNLTA